MSDKVKTEIEKRMERAEYREILEKQYAAFKLELQIEQLLEERNLSYVQFAKALKTSKSNISRDIRGGRIQSATVSRLSRMAKVLGVVFLPLFVSKEVADSIVNKLNEGESSLKNWADTRGRIDRFEVIGIQGTLRNFRQDEKTGNFIEATACSDSPSGRIVQEKRDMYG